MSISSSATGLRPGVVTSTTRPTTPYLGQLIFQTDTGTMHNWDGAAWQFLAPTQQRNVLYNGAMQVAQRGTSTASITATSYYTADRWRFSVNGLGTWTNTIENDAPTGSGFCKSFKVLCTTADASPAASDTLFLPQILEGQDLQAFRKGTSSAQQFTLSFWVKANVTGTYICRLIDLDNTRHTCKSYTISASATWEFKTITFAADTTGAFDNDNAGSLQVQWWLAAGSDFTSGTLATTWASSVSANIAPGQTNLAAATNNYWQITGVQLNVGGVAAPFEFKSYGQELLECQRYCQLYEPAANDRAVIMGVAYQTTQVIGSFVFPVMRAAPTATITNAGTIDVVIGNSVVTSNLTFGAANFTTYSAQVDATNTGAVFTLGHAGLIRFDSGFKMVLSAEL